MSRAWNRIEILHFFLYAELLVFSIVFCTSAWTRFFFFGVCLSQFTCCRWTNDKFIELEDTLGWVGTFELHLCMYTPVCPRMIKFRLWCVCACVYSFKDSKENYMKCHTEEICVNDYEICSRACCVPLSGSQSMIRNAVTWYLSVSLSICCHWVFLTHFFFLFWLNIPLTSQLSK